VKDEFEEIEKSLIEGGQEGYSVGNLHLIATRKEALAAARITSKRILANA
jgi:hypothetical protein